MDIPYYREYDLPWTDSGQERRFHRLLLVVLVITFVLGAIWPLIPVPKADPFQAVEVPPRIAKLVLEQRTPPPPVPRPEPVEPEPRPVEPEAQPVPETVPEQVVKAEPKPAPSAESADTTQGARERARAALLPFAAGLASLRDNEVVERVTDNRPLTASVGRAERNERSVIVSKAGSSSGGINTAALSRNTGGTGFGGRETTQVESPGAIAGLNTATGAGIRGSADGKPSRSREEIELVFDANKGAIFALYNRALRTDPTLQGKLVLRLTIAPSGEVTFCEVVSSELGDSPSGEEMEQKLVQRVLLFRFEPKDVEAVTTTKPIDFFPA